jgi:hypothetical protein
MNSRIYRNLCLLELPVAFMGQNAVEFLPVEAQLIQIFFCFGLMVTQLVDCGYVNFKLKGICWGLVRDVRALNILVL